MQPFFAQKFEIEVGFVMALLDRSTYFDTQDGLRQEYDVHA